MALQYAVRRSLRAKRLVLRVNQAGAVELVVPRRISFREAFRFAESKRLWVERTLQHYHRLAAQVPRRSLVTGETLPFLDEQLCLRVDYGPWHQPTIQREERMLCIRLPVTASVREVAIDWYRGEAREFFVATARGMADALGVHIAHLSVRDARTRWGSCSPGGRLGFNWTLLLAPAAVARYVAAHEVAHLRHLNHSRRFWQLVERLDPHCAKHRRWLTRYGHTLVL